MINERRFAAIPRVAVIGGGISGLGAAWTLAKTHHVTLFEAEKRIGGHARTVTAGKNGDQPVDTGFIVFNYANYPHLANLFNRLDVPVIPSNMSFGASIGGGRIEYALRSLDAIFAQRKNILNPSYLRMLRDIVHFNKNAVVAADDPAMTIAGLLTKLGTGPWFRDYYLLPLSGAIWSTPTEQIMDFPAHAMMQFFKNHALISRGGQHQWYTVQGGSIQYVTRLESALRTQGVDIRTGAPVIAVKRDDDHVQIRAHGGEWETFDEVIFATHTDDTHRMLADATQSEDRALSAFAYQPNEVVLHADTSIMPKRRKCWSSWVYTEDATNKSDRIDLTYWMNSLQSIPENDPLFVTLNTKRTIREELIYDQVTLRHPVYDLAALRARDQLQAMNGQNRTWFCGAWMGNGFHEDGLKSGIEVAAQLSAATQRALEAL